jgi:hypothetical protein
MKIVPPIPISRLPSGFELRGEASMTGSLISSAAGVRRRSLARCA